MSTNRLIVLGLAAAAVFALGVLVGWTRSTWANESWPSILKRLVKPILIMSAVLFVVIQFIPYGRDHTNPPVLAEPVWNSSETRNLAVVACFDCHSNETVWPWYSNVAPFSWLVQRDVENGRADANWSEWMVDSESDSSRESAETIEEGSMPLGLYAWLHPKARLSDEDLDLLAAGMKATFGRESE